MTDTICIWCWKPCKVSDDYDDLRNKAVCSRGCKDAETLFNIHFSDDNIADRAVWERLKNEQGKDK